MQRRRRQGAEQLITWRPYSRPCATTSDSPSTAAGLSVDQNAGAIAHGRMRPRSNVIARRGRAAPPRRRTPGDSQQWRQPRSARGQPGPARREFQAILVKSGIDQRSAGAALRCSGLRAARVLPTSRTGARCGTERNRRRGATLRATIGRAWWSSTTICWRPMPPSDRLSLAANHSSWFVRSSIVCTALNSDAKNPAAEIAAGLCRDPGERARRRICASAASGRR